VPATDQVRPVVEQSPIGVFTFAQFASWFPDALVIVSWSVLVKFACAFVNVPVQV
jgi:hypothetical protein